MPVGALTSITHRVIGIVLALGIPFGCYALQLWLASAQLFDHLMRIAGTSWFKASLNAFV